VGLSSNSGLTLGSSSSMIVGASPTPIVLGCSSGEFSVSSSLMTVVEEVFAVDPQQAVVGCFSVTFSVGSDHVVGGTILVASASLIPFASGCVSDPVVSHLSVFEEPAKRAVEDVHSLSRLSALGLALSGSPSCAPGSPSSAPILMPSAPATSAFGCSVSEAKGYFDGYAPSDGCSDLGASPIAKKGAIFESDGLFQAPKWLVGFGPSGELVLARHPDMSLNWVSDGVGDAIEEELHLVKKVARLKIKGKRGVESEKHH
jgi:hypothetical protein